MSSANFKVAPQLASLLGETYRSSEYALKELIDNSWDADASNVWITLPSPLSNSPILINDDGSGMTEREIREEYLFIANSRTSRKGERTNNKNRYVKGRKGIGKFAGLMIANTMEINTYARGNQTRLIIPKEEILKSKNDLEKVDLSVETQKCSPDINGTEISLSRLNQNYHFPNPERLKQILILEYGRQNGFNIFVNNVAIDVEDIPGQTFTGSKHLTKAGNILYKFTVTDGKTTLKRAGIAIRIIGKIVGKPDFLGLENHEEIPQKLLKRIYGEVEANGLKDDVTADWGTIFESSIGLEEVREFVKPILEDALKKQYQKEINLQKARIQKSINRKLEQLPQHKKAFAVKAIESVLKRFFDESDEKIDTIVSIILEAIEKDYYYEVLHHIGQAKDQTIEQFAEALLEFGLMDISLIAKQANFRRKFLDYIDELADNDDTSEEQMHIAFEKNLWLLGSSYSLYSTITSNKTLKTTFKTLGVNAHTDDRSNKRADLLMCQSFDRKYLLIEFKRPSHTITRDDENQAEKYRDDLSEKLGNSHIEIWLVGGKVNSKISNNIYNKTENIKLLTFKNIIHQARHQIDWLLNELNQI